MTLSTLRDPVLFRQREAVLAGAAPDERVRIRPEVLASWHRSLSCDVDPGGADPGFVDGMGRDSRLTDAAVPVIDRAFERIDSGTAALVLTDADGTVVRRWSSGGRLARALGEPYSQPGHSLAEASVGTNAVGIVGETARPFLIQGPEHYSESFFSLVCAGAPIFHPLTSKLIGILDVTCKRTDAHAVLLAWVSGIAADVQQELLNQVSRAEHLLLEEYVRLSRGPGKGPVICLNDRTIIATPPAARIIDGVNQAFLWEHAAGAISRSQDETFDLALTDGQSVTVRCRPINDGARVVGATVRVIERSGKPSPTPADAVSGPSSGIERGPVAERESPAWRHACAEFARGIASGVPVVLRGEPGVGKRTLARFGLPDARLLEMDAATGYADDITAWLAWLGQALESDTGHPLLVRHLDALEAPHRRVVLGLVEARYDRGPRPVILTETDRSSPDRPQTTISEHVDSFEVTVPALRERREDLPSLLTRLSSSVSGAPRRWLPDAVQAVARRDWPGNVRELQNMVRSVVAVHPTGDIGLRQLPADVLAEGSQRNLGPMERLEYNAIVAALQVNGGNKLDAAASLQISRSTLYRKMRAFGLDLDRCAY